MPSRRRTGLVVTGVALCLAVSAFWLSRSTPEPRATAAASQAPPEASAPSSAYGARRLRWAVGESRRYEVAASSTLRVNPGAMFDPQAQVATQALRVDLEGVLLLDVIAELEGDAIVRGALVPSKIRVEAPEQGVVESDSPLGGTMRALLATPLVLRIASTGRIEGVRVPVALAEQQNLLLAIKQIPAALQVVFPTTPGMRRWEASQEDVTGHFLAGYALDGDAVTIEKRAYTSVSTEAGRMPVGGDIDVRSQSTSALTLDSAGWALTSKATERLFLKYGGRVADARTGVTASHQGELTIKRIGFDPRGASDGGVEGWRALDEHPLSYVYAQKPVDTDPRTLPDLLRELRASRSLATEGERTREAAALMQAIALKLRSDPAAVAAVLDRIRREGAREADEAGVLLGALGTAGNPAAQSALSTVLTDEALPTTLHVQALTQLAFVQSPTADAVSTVKKKTRSSDDEEQSTSTLVLGAMARSMGDEAPEAAAREVEELIARYRSATSLDEKMLLLSALGNTGSADALPTMLEALGSDVPGMRLEAVRALRFMPPGVADATIDRVLFGDASADVRKAAVFALGFRDLTQHASIIGTVLGRDTTAAVRLALTHLLGASLDKYPPALAILKSLSTSDPDEDVRKAAQSYVQSARPASSGSSGGPANLEHRTGRDP